MNRYLVNLKKPFRGQTIWGGIGHVTGYLPTPESDKDRTRRENVCNRLENLSGTKPHWKARRYQYEVELTEEQARQVATWGPVRSVVKL